MQTWKNRLIGLAVMALVCTHAYAQEVNLVLLRHGESQMNVEKRFSGWSNTQLTEKGKQQAQDAGQNLRHSGVKIDVVHTSFLDRAIKTAWLAMENMEQVWLPQKTYWRLNERNYGDLEGKTHQEVADKVGEDQVKVWRRSFDVPPPALSLTDVRSPDRDIRYAQLDKRVLPQSESMKDTITRIEPYWTDDLRPALLSGQNVLVVAHSNSLKALSSWLEPNLKPDEIVKLEIPNATPVVYRFKVTDNEIRLLSRKVLEPKEEKTNKKE